jgi:hypothetical protein
MELHTSNAPKADSGTGVVHDVANGGEGYSAGGMSEDTEEQGDSSDGTLTEEKGQRDEREGEYQPPGKQPVHQI